jgi:hypothetical protein
VKSPFFWLYGNAPYARCGECKSRIWARGFVTKMSIRLGMVTCDPCVTEAQRREKAARDAVDNGS